MINTNRLVATLVLIGNQAIVFAQKNSRGKKQKQQGSYDHGHNKRAREFQGETMTEEHMRETYEHW